MNAIDLAEPRETEDGLSWGPIGYLAGGSQEVTLTKDKGQAWRYRLVTRNRSGEHIQTRTYKTRGGCMDAIGRLFNVQIIRGLP